MRLQARKEFVVDLWEMLLGTALTAVGISLMIKSTLGQTAYVSLSRNIAFAFQKRAGTVLFFVNTVCVVANLLITRRDFDKKQVLQIPLALFQGQLVNLLVYDLPWISSLEITKYPVKWMVAIAGVFILSYGIAVLMQANLVKMPVEDLAYVISVKVHKSFAFVRQMVDVACVAGSLLLILVFHLGFQTLREGTWACMILLGPSLRITMPLAQKFSLKERIGKEP